MKVGILGMLRHNIDVTYYTNGEIWDWRFGSLDGGRGQKVLSIRFDRAKPHKAINDPTITLEDIREGRRRAKKDTTVVIQGLAPEDVQFENYLFLIPPVNAGALETEIGTIMTGEIYRARVYVKGIYVETRSDPPALHYGVNFTRAALDRDRRSCMSDNTVGQTLVEIWDTLVREGKPGAVRKYLDLLLDKREWLEVQLADEWITRESAERLVKELRSLHPDQFFYCADGKDVTEVFPLWSYVNIRTSESFAIVYNRVRFRYPGDYGTCWP
jgi:hypothetical protein